MGRGMRGTVIGALGLVLGMLAGCAATPDETAAETDWSARVDELTDVAWQRLLDDALYLRIKFGLPITEFPDLTPEAAAVRVRNAEDLLRQIDEVPMDALSPEDVLTLAMVRWDASNGVEAAPFHWLQFPYTPYIGGFTFNVAHQALASQSLASVEEAANYLGLLEEYGEQIDQIRGHAEGQIERGIYASKQALPGIVGLLRGLHQGAPELLGVSEARVETLPDGERAAFQSAVEEAIEARIGPAFEALLAVFESEEYQASAPEAVGLSQYPGGEAYYRFLVRLHTTLDKTPEELHKMGQAAVAALAETKAEIRQELGVDLDQASFEGELRRNPRFVAQAPADVEARYMEYVARIEPLIPDFFSTLPKAPYGVARLPPTAEAGMTFGYYQAPTPSEPVGRYLYNGSQLDQRSLLTAGPLIYHELVPGHHFQIALQNENENLPLYRRESFSSTAFTEGWANYGAHLAWENGLLDDPYERYAFAVFDTFFAVRLVVDTGMNLYGWSLEEARTYMREHLFESDTEIATESLRYSTDMPGQALAYKSGYARILEMREEIRQRQGEAFDIRAFHDAVLGSGALPLSLLERHLDRVLIAEP